MQTTTLQRASLQTFPWEFSKTSKIIQLFLLVNLWITIKSNQLEEKVQAVWFFEETNRNKENMTHCSQKKRVKNTQVFLKTSVPNRKNPRKWNYGWICKYFNKAFLMALTPKEQLFISRSRYKRFFHNDNLLYFQ